MTTGLVGDIGGTNARFALIDSAAPATLRDPVSVKCADYPDIVQSIRAYLAGKSGLNPASAVLAAAGPITGDEFRQNNGPWQFSISRLREELKIPSLRVVNDFVAMAHGVAVLSEDRVATIGAVRADETTAAGPWLVIGPGTGLGVAVIIDPDRAPRVLESEGGNAGLAPSDETELEIARTVLRQGTDLPWERLVSGPGLRMLHAVMAELDGRVAAPITPEDIVWRALENNDPFCRAVLDRFCGLLGSAAGDMALIVKARRVYLAGAIVQAILPHLRESAFRERFEQRGKYGDVLDDVPTLAALGADIGLIGAAAILNSDK